MKRNKKKILRSSTVSESIYFFEEIIMRMNEDGYTTVVVTSPGKDLELYKKKYPLERVREVPMERRISIVKDIRSLWRMIKVMCDEKPYIVHSITPKAGLITILAAWIMRVPIRIHTFTGLVWPTEVGLKRKILKLADRIICSCATHIIPEGQGVLDDLKTHGVCRKPMRVLGYGNVRGVDMSRFNPSRFSYIKKDQSKFRFIYVGRIVGDKGINELVKAFIRLNSLHPETHLVLIGSYESNLDPIDSEIKRIIEDSSSISFCGPKYDDELLEEYMKSDCFIMPSYREGFPNTVLEAGAMGLPSIVTNINGSREIIINGENGLVVESKNVDALYTAMEDILLNEVMRNQMALKARDLIESRFEKKFVQDCLIRYYKAILIKQ